MSDIHEDLGYIKAKVEKIDEINTKLDSYSKRLRLIESWKDTLMGKIAVIGAAFGAFCTAIGYWLKGKFN